uniref:Uncharacterized protein n=1 Tax=Aegilops tauschii subsp. strangulata TaxID=200361 RepID=A0A453RN90_AEGTS
VFLLFMDFAYSYGVKTTATGGYGWEIQCHEALKHMAFLCVLSELLRCFWGDMNFFSVELELCIYMWSVLCFIKAVENLKCNKLSELCKLESSTLYMGTWCPKSERNHMIAAYLFPMNLAGARSFIYKDWLGCLPSICLKFSDQ